MVFLLFLYLIIYHLSVLKQLGVPHILSPPIYGHVQPTLYSRSSYQVLFLTATAEGWP